MLSCAQVPELPVYGVAIPTISGLRLVLNKLDAAQGLLACLTYARRAPSSGTDGLPG